eukprot:CAMPEP_0198154414 /NCGR_PEP_ID=MMETSP1443-20131203/68564_1 /TAXON_ID=186043 /ORGANISM="Entomoneis sp., Strain CCMP2396" /LENGTH=618 /DNA_ID=CAMNT_0043821085 /DNA_START=111 /DNA_END=1967 /DNA_ORIENTATION=-
MFSGQRRKPSSGLTNKDQTRLRIEKMEAERRERRLVMEKRKIQRAAEAKANLKAGNPGDIDFIGMIRKWREERAHKAQPHRSNASIDDSHCQPALCICVRKRPLSDKEREKLDHDSVTVLNPTVWVHSAKLRVDGITKYLDHNSFQLDHVFDETCNTRQLYESASRPLLEFCCQGTGGRATIFAYGQTGSGKTFTMSEIQNLLVQDLFALLSEELMEDDDPKFCTHDNCRVVISFFEMYGGCIQDLLNQRQRLKVLEDGKGEVIVTGLSEREANNPQELLDLLAQGNETRTTHTTEANDSSSRSHSICQIMLRDIKNDKLRGKLSLVDLAGSERGADTKSHNSQRRAESADINTSLLALKECIRALDKNVTSGHRNGEHQSSHHVPYRGSKLTLILKDCFTSPKAMTTMIATVSPGASSTDHSLNTLRYADRIKEHKVGSTGKRSATMVQLKRKVDRKKQSKQLEPDSDDDVERNDRVNVSVDSDDFFEASMVQEKSIDDNVNEEEEQEKGQEPQLENEEDELRRTVDSLLDQEEAILSLHMKNIHENAELLSEEGKLLQDIQRPNVTSSDIDEYMDALIIILDRKEDMIINLQEKLGLFRVELLKEKDLSARVQEQH